MALVGAAAMAVAGMASAAPAPYVGVNFTGGGNSIAAQSLDPADVAGVLPQANWNNVNGASGSGVALKDANGNATPVTLTFSGAGTWSSGAGAATPNQKLMQGYVDGTDNGHNDYLFANVPAGVYNVLVYAQPDSGDGRDQSVIINGVSGAAVYVSSDASSDFRNNGNVFVRATATSKDGAGASGNYVEFDGISPVAGFISLQGQSLNFRNFANGIQLVQAPEPATIGVLGVGAVGVLARRRRKE